MTRQQRDGTFLAVLTEDIYLDRSMLPATHVTVVRVTGKFKSLKSPESLGFGRDRNREDISGDMEHSTGLTLVSLPSEVRLHHPKTVS